MNRRIDVLYCDDIRHEMGEKLSLIGVYTSGIAVPEFPFRLPRLSIFVRITTPITNPFRAVTVNVLQNDSAIASAETGDLSGMPLNISGRDKTEIDLVFVLGVNSPVFFEPCELVVQAVCDSEVLYGKTISVELREDPAG